MTSDRPFTHRLIGALMLAAAVLGTAMLGVPTASADPGPTRIIPAANGTIAVQGPPISAVTVLAFGHEATLSFTTAEPSEVTVTHTPATGRAVAGLTPAATIPAITPATTPAGAFRAPTGVLSEPTNQHVFRQYTTTHQVKLTGLTSNTAYNVSVVAETQAGQKHTAEVRVVTAKQRVRVTLREINITDDGDLDVPTPFGDIERAGDPRWVVGLTWTGGSVGSCFPIGCSYGSYTGGRIFPRNSAGDSLTWLFAQENFDTLPARFELHTYTEEDDGVLGTLGAVIVDCYNPAAFACSLGHTDIVYWQMPQRVEASSTTVTVRGVDEITCFESVLTFTFDTFHDQLSYPAPKRNAPSSTWDFTNYG